MTTDRFHRAAKDGLKDVLREATKRECNGKDEQGMTPTLYAAFYGHLDALRVLCGRGGDPDKQDLFGNTAMHLSAAQGHREIVAFLASFGANIFAMDIDQRTPQDVAGVNGREEVLHFLDKFTAHLDATDKKKSKSMKERARKDWEKLNKEYHKFQGRMETNNKLGGKPLKHSFMNTLRFKIQKSGSIPNLQDASTMDIRARTSFSGITMPKRGLSAVQQKAFASKLAQQNAGDFKISEIEDGKRSVRIINGTRSGSEIIFSDPIQEHHGNQNNFFNDKGHNINGIASDDEDRPDGIKNKLTRSVSQPDFINELNNNNNNPKTNNRKDSGILHEPASIFVRPGVGSLAFRKSITHTLYSMPLPDNAIDESSIGSAGSLAQQPLVEDDILYGSSDEENTSTPIERFLTAFKLSELIPLFEEQKIDLDTLLMLTEDDLNKLNLKVGHYRHLVIAITERKNALEHPGEVVDSML